MEIAVPTSLDAGEKKAGGRAGVFCYKELRSRENETK
jgi:hypothetical protein